MKTKMKTAEQPEDPKKLKGDVRLAGLRLAKAKHQLKSAKEHARLAKRRRKEAKLAARRARKQARAAKGEFKKAEKVLADAKAKLARANRLLASARRRKKPGAKTAIQTAGGKVEPAKPAVAVPRVFETPTPAPSIPESVASVQAETGVISGRTRSETQL